MKKIFVFLCLLPGTMLQVQGQIAAWDFYGQSMPATCAATTFNANLISAGGASHITRGPGAPASAGVHSFRTTGFQNNGVATTNTDYFQVTLEPAAGYKLSLSTIDAKFNGTASFYASPGVTSQFAYSLDGIAFTLIGSPVQSASLTMAQVDLSTIAGLQNVYAGTTVTIRYYASGQTATGGWGFYSGSAGTNGLAFGGTVEPAVILAPTLQAGNITFNNVQWSQMGLSWTPGNGEKRVVMINTSNSFSIPADGTDPPASALYTGSGEQVIYNGAGNALATVTGLTSGTTYWFRIYEYNGAGPLTMYLADPAAGNPASQTTSSLQLPPVINLPSVAAISDTAATMGGHIVSDGGSSITGRGTRWDTASPLDPDDHALAEGGTDTGYFSHLRTGLPPGKKIFFAAWATNAAGSGSSEEGSFYTLSEVPEAHVTGFSAVATGTTSISLSWTPCPVPPSGYLLLRKTGPAPPSAIPLNALAYAAGDTIGDAVVAGNLLPGSLSAFPVTGLSPGTLYTFTIIPYNHNGIDPATTHYLTEPVIPAASDTTLVPVVATFHWTGLTGNDWNTPSNWEPAREIPAPNDILIFDRGGIPTIVNITSQTVGQLHVDSTTYVTLQGSGTLLVAGDEGVDVSVAWPGQLNISGTTPLILSLGANATGAVSGSMTLSGGGHRVLVASPGSMVFNQGGTFRTGSGFSGNPFGTTSLLSVVFSIGSTYVCQGGGNPFGAPAPASVVVFQPGSLYRLDAYAVPSFGGRTYGNFEMNYPGMVTVTGTSAVSIDHFIASQGTFNFNVTGNPGHAIRGNITIAGVATLIFGPSSPGTVLLNGTSPAIISGTGTLMAGPNSTLAIGNGSGVTLAMDATVNNLTILTGGLFTIAPEAALTVNGTLVNGAPATGFVIDGDASLIHHTPGVMATVYRPVEAATWTNWQDGWHLLSSPVSGQAIDSAGGFTTSGEGNDFDFYTWLETGNSWVNFKNITEPPTFSMVNGGSHFTPGRGYLAAYQQTGIKKFSGQLNVTGLASGNLTVSGEGSMGWGWHLLGNPYPCSLSWYTNWLVNNIGGVAQIWNEAGQSYTPRNPGDPLPPCNGFMVQVTGSPGDSGELTIPASSRMHGNTPWFRQATYPVITLIVHDLDHPSFQESQVRFNPAATPSFDPEFDGRFLPGYAPRFYSVLEGEKLSVNSLGNPGSVSSIPFGFEKGNGDYYRLTVLVSGVIGERMILSDLETGQEHDLSQEPSYEFSAGEGAPPGRFILRFRDVGIPKPPASRTRIYSSGNTICIAARGSAHAEIFTLTGARYWSGTLADGAGHALIVDVEPGFYLVRVVAQESAIVRKLHVGSL